MHWVERSSVIYFQLNSNLTVMKIRADFVLFCSLMDVKRLEFYDSLKLWVNLWWIFSLLTLVWRTCIQDFRFLCLCFNQLSLLFFRVPLKYQILQINSLFKVLFHRKFSCFAPPNINPIHLQFKTDFHFLSVCSAVIKVGITQLPFYLILLTLLFKFLLGSKLELRRDCTS